MELECNSCGYEWDYQGDSDFYATCPNCQYKVKIQANAEVVESESRKDETEERNKAEMGISAKARVVTSETGTTRFDEKEEMFIKEIADLEDPKGLDKIFSKYDQEEFNSVKKKVKQKANRIREDLKKYEKIENFLDEKEWEYSEP